MKVLGDHCVARAQGLGLQSLGDDSLAGLLALPPQEHSCIHSL